MKLIFIPLLLLVSFFAPGQSNIDPSKLPLVRYQPSIYVNGIDQRGTIRIKDVLEHGLQVVLGDKTFKVVQFDLVYDCHSRAVFDFSVKRYSGNRVDPKDDYLQKRILVGDVITIDNTVIEKNGERYRMKDIGCDISN